MTLIGEEPRTALPSPEKEVIEEEGRRAARALLNVLTPRERGVVERRFGLTTDEPQTLDAIGAVYGVTRERIRQIEKKALEKLRDEYGVGGAEGAGT